MSSVHAAMRGTLLGVAIGDALGMPVETWVRAYIMALSQGKGITDLIAPVSRKIRRDKDTEAGDTTDDWQLTEVVAESIIANKGHFNLEHCAGLHVQALQTSTFGWGGTTTKAIAEIRDGNRAYNTRAPSYGPKTGLGNGVMMKIAPLAIAHYRYAYSLGGPEKLRAEVMALSRLTHADDRAGVAALAVAETILYGYNNAVKSTVDKQIFLEHLLSRVEIAESLCEARDEWEQNQTTTVSDVIRMVQHVWQFIRLDQLRPEFNSLSTLEICLIMFLRHSQDFEQGLCAAVNSGGDTDTQAAILGSMLGAQVGEMGIPKKWLTFRGKFDHARTVADRLIAVCA